MSWTSAASKADRNDVKCDIKSPAVPSPPVSCPPQSPTLPKTIAMYMTLHRYNFLVRPHTRPQPSSQILEGTPKEARDDLFSSTRAPQVQAQLTFVADKNASPRLSKGSLVASLEAIQYQVTCRSPPPFPPCPSSPPLFLSLVCVYTCVCVKCI